MTKIFLGGFPLDITELSLVQLLSYHGEVSTIKIVRNKQTGLCKGYAFIEIASLNDAKQIIKALDGTMLGERALTINIVAGADVVKAESKPPAQSPAPVIRFTRKINVPDTALGKAKRPRIKI
jgi:RNA recognition motif-containing protein